MTVFMDINAALDSRLNSMPGLPPVAWPNVEFCPTPGTMWVRPTILPGGTSGATTMTDEHIGIYRVDVFSPAGTGKGSAIVMADSIADFFKPMTELTFNGRAVRCLKVGIGNAVQDDEWYHVPVDITYLSHTIKR